MNRYCNWIVAAGFAAASLAAQAQDHGTKDEAIALVSTAAAHVQKAGAEQAYKDFSDKGNAAWRKKDLYVFVVRYDGVTLAHGANEKLIGKDMSALKDQDGKLFLQEMGAVAKKSGTGWVEYSWIHPETKKPAPKASYVKALPAGDAYVAVGIYR